MVESYRLEPTFEPSPQETQEKAFQLVLKQSRSMSEMLVTFLKTQNPTLAKQLRRLVKDSEE